MNKKTIKLDLNRLRSELSQLEKSVYDDSEVKVALDAAKLRIQPKVDVLKAKIVECEKIDVKNKPTRWPENCPENVLKAASDRWRGTDEFRKYRIHAWNSKAFWTSYPSGGYTNNGGWNPTSAYFEMVSLIHTSTGMGRTHGIKLLRRDGRTSLGFMVAELQKLEMDKS